MPRIKFNFYIIISLLFSSTVCCAEDQNNILQEITLIEHSKKITFSAECRKSIESKYKETGQNNLFWERLPVAVNAIQINDPEIKVLGIKEMKYFLETKWVDVKLRSTPVTAKVYYRDQNNLLSGFIYEGETPLHRKYEVGTYSFKFDADGYQSEQVEINVPKDSGPIKKTIRLRRKQ